MIPATDTFFIRAQHLCQKLRDTLHQSPFGIVAENLDKTRPIDANIIYAVQSTKA